ncbi:MAG: hypothetical protein GY845_00240 [Planctomycetes bacterium]|nr:hypothetical protein [Planctomycetota bacterium]
MSTTLIPPTTLTREPARQTAVALARSTTPQWPQLPGDSWRAGLNEDERSANRHQASVSPGQRRRRSGHLQSAQKCCLPSGNFQIHLGKTLRPTFIDTRAYDSLKDRAMLKLKYQIETSLSDQKMGEIDHIRDGNEVILGF